MGNEGLRIARSEEALEKFKGGDLVRNVDLISAKAKSAEPIWGCYFFKSAITIIVGDPGIGKTTMMYEMMYAITEGKPFLNIPPKTEVKALLLDFESSDSLIKGRYRGGEYPNIRIINDPDYSFDDLTPVLIELQKTYPYNVFVVDNLLTAFDTFDENDNAEAVKKIKRIRRLSTMFNCAGVVLHHPSKANLQGMRKGSGAFAWARHGDIYLNLNAVMDCPDMVELEIAKNRWAEDKTSIYFNKEGEGMFARCQPPVGSMNSASKLEQAKSLIYARKGIWQRKELVEYVCGHIEEISQPTIVRAIERLTQEGKIRQNMYDGYEIK